MKEIIKLIRRLDPAHVYVYVFVKPTVFECVCEQVCMVSDTSLASLFVYVSVTLICIRSISFSLSHPSSLPLSLSLSLSLSIFPLHLFLCMSVSLILCLCISVPMHTFLQSNIIIIITSVSLENRLQYEGKPTSKKMLKRWSRKKDHRRKNLNPANKRGTLRERTVL